MQDELWDLCDRTGQPTGETHRRGDEMPADRFHVVASILAVRTDGKLLLTRRAAGKTYPLSWEIPAGSVLAGESSEEGALRELREETGVDVDSDRLRFIGRATEESALFDLYVASVPPTTEVAPDPEEVADFEWTDIAGLDARVADGSIAAPWVSRLELFRAALGAFTENRWL